MKWTVDNCKFGDIIRIKCGSVLHYGIYVSDEQVIQFGLPPTAGLITDPDGVVVCATDMDEFCCGNFVEVGIPDRAERKKRLPPAVTVANAQARLGEGGYDLITNNCEHFANECYFGVHRSEQEEALRGKWQSRAVLDVYISAIAKDTDAALVPTERQNEVRSVSSEKLKMQKISAWKLLGAAVKRSFGFDLDALKFSKRKNGKWVCDKLWFSIAHTDTAVVVAVCDSPCGVDAEDISAFTKKNDAGSLIPVISAKGEIITSADLLSAWLKKESAYKAFGKRGFEPRKTAIADYKYRLCKHGDTAIAVCAKNPSAARFFISENGGISLMATEAML